eukprot:m.103109 g.103109  ORF g.103109 m.103109 type:complete len:364 (-) comp9088_c12_seq2:2123-3214(-)
MMKNGDEREVKVDDGDVSTHQEQEQQRTGAEKKEKKHWSRFTEEQLQSVDIHHDKFSLFRTKMHPEEWHDILVLILMMPITLIRVGIIIFMFLTYTFWGFIFNSLGYIDLYLRYASPFGNMLLLYVAGIEMKLEGEENIRLGSETAKAEDRPILVVSNHISALDPHCISYSLGNCIRPVIKTEIFSIPVYGSIAKLLGCVGVDRTKPSGVVDTLKNYFKERNPNDFPLYVCPEGTTTNGRGLLKFKKGIFLSDVEVIPLSLNYKTPFNTTFVLNQPSLGLDLLQLIKVLSVPQKKAIHIKALPPMKRGDDEDYQHFADRVADAMASSLKVPYTSLSFSDGILFYSARRYFAAQEEAKKNKKMN